MAITKQLDSTKHALSKTPTYTSASITRFKVWCTIPEVNTPTEVRFLG